MSDPTAPEGPIPEAPITVIRDAAWAVVWNAEAGRHEYARGVDVVFQGDRIVSADGTWTGPADAEIDGRERMVMPGFVDVHSHPSFETMLKGLTEEVYSPKFYMSSLYEFLTLFEIDEEGMRASTEVALAELLQSGVTSLCDISFAHEGWLDGLAATGIRAFAAPMFRNGPWKTSNGHSVHYELDEKRGEESMRAAMACLDEAARHPSGRVSGVVSPSQIDTCFEGLLREAMQEAEARDLPFTIHAAQGVIEFNEMIRRHGVTPIRWMQDIGILNERTLIGHGIFLDSHPQVGWTTSSDDLGMIADAGASVAHCPTVFVRRGISLQHFSAYVERGVNMTIGTDTHPQNMVEELKTAIYVARTISGNAAKPTAEALFHAATVGGAKALRRDDIGKIEPGAKADLVLVDITHASLRPLRDPVRALIFSGGERPIKDVYVDGRKVVEDGRAIFIDYDSAMVRVEAAQKRSMDLVHTRDWAGRSADAAMPPVFPIRGHNRPAGH